MATCHQRIRVNHQNERANERDTNKSMQSILNGEHVDLSL